MLNKYAYLYEKLIKSLFHERKVNFMLENIICLNLSFKYQLRNWPLIDKNFCLRAGKNYDFSIEIFKCYNYLIVWMVHKMDYKSWSD